jgi:hypothetical protein
MTHNSRRAALLFTLALLVAAAPASAQFASQWTNAHVGSQLLSTHVAYDDKHDVYLQVTSGSDQSAVMGRFVSADGQSLGSAFVIGTRRNVFSGESKVAYSRGTSDDVFLVIYWSDANGASTFAQRVRYTGTGTTGGALLGDYIPVSPFSLGSECVSKPNDVIYNPVAQRFLVSYEEFPRTGGCAYGGLGVDIMVRSFGADGSALTNAVNVTAALGDQRASALALDWQRNSYGVVFEGDRPGTEGLVRTGIFLKRLDGTTGAPTTTGNPSFFTFWEGRLQENPTMFARQPAIAYLPESDAFVVAYVVPQFYSGVSEVLSNALLSSESPSDQFPCCGAVRPSSFPFSSPGIGDLNVSMDYEPISRKIVFVGTGTDTVARMAIMDRTYGLATTFIIDSGIGPATAPVRAAEGGFGVASLNTDSRGRLKGFQFAPASSPGPRFVTADVRAALESPSGPQSSGSLTMTGYALDTHATAGCGVDFVDVYAFPSGAASIFVGRVTSFISRPDVRTALALPAQFANCGFSVDTGRLPAGSYTLAAFPHSSVTSQFSGTQTTNISIPSQPYSYIDTPANGSTQGSAFTVSGWALDLGAGSGPGVDTIHIWAFRDGGGASPQFFLGTQTARPDVAAAVGSSQFTNSGFTANITGLTSGTWDIVVFGHSSVTGAFQPNPAVVRVTVP